MALPSEHPYGPAPYSLTHAYDHLDQVQAKTLHGIRVDIIPDPYGFYAGLVQFNTYVKTTRSRLIAAYWVLRWGNGVNDGRDTEGSTKAN